jgi:hypothetical protein
MRQGGVSGVVQRPDTFPVFDPRGLERVLRLLPVAVRSEPRSRCGCEHLIHVRVERTHPVSVESTFTSVGERAIRRSPSVLLDSITRSGPQRGLRRAIGALPGGHSEHLVCRWGMSTRHGQSGVQVRARRQSRSVLARPRAGVPSGPASGSGLTVVSAALAEASAKLGSGGR